MRVWLQKTTAMAATLTTLFLKTVIYIGKMVIAAPLIYGNRVCAEQVVGVAAVLLPIAGCRHNDDQYRGISL